MTCAPACPGPKPGHCGALRRTRGATAKAPAELRQVLDGEVRALESDHPSTLTTRTNVATVLAAQGQTAKALAEFRQVLAVQSGCWATIIRIPWPQ
jgi:hypothetical protein